MNTISVHLIPLISSTAWAVGRHAIWAEGTPHKPAIASIQKDLDSFMIALATGAYGTEDEISQELAVLNLKLKDYVELTKPEALLAA